MKIEIISGSPRKESISYRVALFLQKELSSKTNHHVGLIDVRDWNLGLQNQVFKSVETTPDEFKPLAERIFSAEAFILVTPEYNGSYTAALKNLLDHFPKQSRKAFGLVTSSTGALGGMRCAQQLLLLVAGLFGIASPHLMITSFTDKRFDAEGNLLDETFAKPVENFINEFVWLAESINSK